MQQKSQVCTTPWIKDCQSDEGKGEELCQTVYTSECFTKQTVHEVNLLQQLGGPLRGFLRLRTM